VGQINAYWPDCKFSHSLWAGPSVVWLPLVDDSSGPEVVLDSSGGLLVDSSAGVVSWGAAVEPALAALSVVVSCAWLMVVVCMISAGGSVLSLLAVVVVLSVLDWAAVVPSVPVEPDVVPSEPEDPEVVVSCPCSVVLSLAGSVVPP
jgi:hypothetical protein